MAAAQPGCSEVKNLEDPFKEVICWVVTILLWDEEQALVSEMAKYCNSLSRHLFNRLLELKD